MGDTLTVQLKGELTSGIPRGDLISSFYRHYITIFYCLSFQIYGLILEISNSGAMNQEPATVKLKTTLYLLSAELQI